MPMKFSPLFWPVSLKGSTISILDETALPRRLTYFRVRTVRQACLAISTMKTRAVGQVLLVMYTFLLMARKHRGAALKREVRKAAGALSATRPTLPFKVLTDMVVGWAEKGVPLEAAIQGFLKNLEEARIAQAQKAAELLENGARVLTHCNVSGLMPLIAGLCRDQGREVSFWVTETRPYLQGMRLTAWELRRASFAVTLITDGTAAQVMHEKKVDAVMVGADHLARNGDIANKIGTYQLALLARHFKIPFYVLCPPASRAGSGDAITLEVRPQEEFFAYLDERVVPARVKAYYPGFDVTPRELITKHIYLEL